MHYRNPLPSPQRGISSEYTGDKSLRKPRRRFSFEPYSIHLILLACFVISADQLLAAPNLTQMAKDFSLTSSERDSYLGALAQLGFYLTAGLFSIIAGPVIEVVDRSQLIGAICALSSILSGSISLLPLGRGGFVYFLLIRCLAGVPFGVMIPTAFSLVADLAPPHKRTTMGALVSTSSTAGAGIGQAISGFIGGSWIHSWRLPYFFLFFFGVFCSILVFLALKDHHRQKNSARGSPKEMYNDESAQAWGGSSLNKSNSGGAAPAAVLKMEDLKWSNFLTVLGLNSNKLIFAQSIPGCIATSCIGTFLPDYIHNDLGFSLSNSTALMIVFGISGLFFSMAGSAYGQMLYNTQRSQLPKFISTCTIIGAVPMILLVTVKGTSAPGFINFLCASIGGAVATAGPNLRGILMNANCAQNRGTVFAMFSLVDNLGKSIGPSVLVLVTMLFGGNRTMGFVVVFSLWFIAAYLQRQLETCFIDDLLAVEIKQDGSTELVKEPFDLIHIFHGQNTNQKPTRH